MPRSVVLLGKGTLAIRAADWFQASREWELTEIVPVVPEPAWTGSLMAWASEHGVPTVTSGRFDEVRTERPALAFSIFYDRIIRKPFIDRCERILNLHNGPLPRYRGVSPVNWALKNGERQHGVTIHEVTPGVDDGPIVSQVEFSVYPEFDEVVDVYERCLEFGWTLFTQTMPILDRIAPAPQEEAAATYYSKADNPRLGDRLLFTRAESQRAAG